MVAKRRKAADRGAHRGWQRLKLNVAATSVHVDRYGPKIVTGEPDGRSSSSITIEGTLDRPAFKTLTRTVLLVLQREEPEGNPGAAIGGSIVWNVVATLPRAQFSDLLALVLADRRAHRDGIRGDQARQRHHALDRVLFCAGA